MHTPTISEKALCSSDYRECELRAINAQETTRSVVLLKELQGLTIAEAARCLGLTVSAVKARLFRARHNLRNHLKLRYKLSPCFVQQSEQRASCSPPSPLSVSRRVIPDITVSAESPTEDDGLSAFLSTRARLFGNAYRILKNAAEAEDLLQEVWIRWQTTNRTAVRNTAAFLMTMTTRLAINVVQSARLRRETFFKPSLQESEDACPNPQMEEEQNERLRSAIGVLLEKLSSAERAAYVLREGFDYSYREIASSLGLGEDNARQLVTRARQNVAGGHHSCLNSSEQRSFLTAFLAVARKGSLATFESFLVDSLKGTVRSGKRRARTGLTLAEPITASRRHRWGLVPQLKAKVA